jgi:TRAP-type mannitol/chloroaromatic compound transport system permease small subunit
VAVIECEYVRTLLKSIDRVNGWMGQAMKWFIIAAAAFTCLEVTQRYVFVHPTMWGYEMPIMIAAAMYLLSWGYVHREKGHVRVDVFYNKFSDRTKAIVDSCCFVVLYMPVIGFLTMQAWKWMVYAISINEKSTFTYWYPPLAPLRIAIFVGLLLFLLQGLAQFWRDLYMAVKGVRYD